MIAHRSSRSIRQCKGLRLADGARFYASGKAHEVEADDERITFPHTLDEVPRESRVTGQIAGRNGSFVFQRTGVFEDGQAKESYFSVWPFL